MLVQHRVVLAWPVCAGKGRRPPPVLVVETSSKLLVNTAYIKGVCCRKKYVNLAVSECDSVWECCVVLPVQYVIWC